MQNKVGSQNELDEKLQEEDYEIDEYTKTKHNKNELHKISNDAKVTKVQKQEHNVIEQIVLSLNKTDKRGNNVKTLKEAFPPEAIEDLGIGLDFFEHDAVKAHSNTADDLKMAIEKVKTVLPYLNGEQSYTEPGVFEDIVNVMLELYESTTAYCYTHLNDSSKEYAQKRFDNAAKIKLALGTVIENSKWIQKQEPLYEYLDKPEEEKSMSPEELEKYKKDNKKEYNKEYKEYTTAKKQLLELSSTYIKWNKNVIRDKFDTPEQKMKHRLDMLDTYKIYFQRYLKFRKKTGRTTEIPFEIKWMMNERKNAIEGLRFVAWAKRNGNASKIQSNKDNIFLEKRVRNEESVDYSLVINEDDVKEEMEMESTLRKRIDKGLTEEQSQAVDRIDRWLIRNYRNGGMAGTVYGGMRNNNSQFVMKLLSMSKRERLYIYYMIETGARKAPSDEDLLKSQSGKYIPDKDKFKSQMIATKFKFTARFFGDYVYWHKLDQAMELLSIRKAELVEAYAPKKKTKAYTAKEKKRERYSKELIQILSDYKSIIMNPNKLPKEAIKEITAAQAARMKELTIKLTGECLEFEQEADQKRGVRFNPTEVEQTQANVDML
ncbi:MAG: hypothetical protein K6B41_08120, partial [Butyrivibrio sp.]|nr:hypothetical protein [Butyrivibrio sp.]